jgi:hypothetical protein
MRSPGANSIGKSYLYSAEIRPALRRNAPISPGTAQRRQLLIPSSWELLVYANVLTIDGCLPALLAAASWPAYADQEYRLRVRAVLDVHLHVS